MSQVCKRCIVEERTTVTPPYCCPRTATAWRADIIKFITLLKNSEFEKTEIVFLY